MYVRQSFRDAYNRVRNKLANFLPYLLIQIIMAAMVIGFMFGAYIAALAGIFSKVRLDGMLFAIVALTCLAAVAVFFALSVFLSLLMERIAYLTSKNTAIKLKSSSLGELINYGKKNFFAFIKLALANAAILLVAFLPLLLAIYLVIPRGDQSGISILLVVLLGAIFGIAFVVLSCILGTARVLFFMGNEKAGVPWLIGTAWKVFRTNIAEYVLFGLAFIGLTIGSGVVQAVLGLIPCLGTIVSFAISTIFGFAVSVLIFVFMSNLVPAKKV